MEKNKVLSKKIYSINKLTKKNNKLAIESTNLSTGTNRPIEKNNKVTKKDTNI